jgi:hypothetical protein
LFLTKFALRNSVLVFAPLLSCWIVIQFTNLSVE